MDSTSHLLATSQARYKVYYFLCVRQVNRYLKEVNYIYLNVEVSSSKYNTGNYSLGSYEVPVNDCDTIFIHRDKFVDQVSPNHVTQAPIRKPDNAVHTISTVPCATAFPEETQTTILVILIPHPLSNV